MARSRTILKVEALRLFNCTTLVELGRVFKLSRAAVSMWPDRLDIVMTDRILGRYARLHGGRIPPAFVIANTKPPKERVRIRYRHKRHNKPKCPQAFQAALPQQDQPQPPQQRPVIAQATVPSITSPTPAANRSAEAA